MSDPTLDAPISPEELEPHALQYSSLPSGATDDNRLSRGDVACIIIRVVGVYVLINSLQFVPRIFEGWNAPLQYQVQAFIPWVTAVAVGVAALLFSRKLAGWLLPRTAIVVAQSNGSPQAQLLAMAFAVLGAYAFLTGLPLIAWYFTLIFFPAGKGWTNVSLDTRVTQSLSGLARHGSECAAGLWLFFGSKRLAAFWWRLRHPEFKDVYRDEQKVDTIS